jgi:hypothetical protein
MNSAQTDLAHVLLGIGGVGLLVCNSFFHLNLDAGTVTTVQGLVAATLGSFLRGSPASGQ